MDEHRKRYESHQTTDFSGWVAGQLPIVRGYNGGVIPKYDYDINQSLQNYSLGNSGTYVCSISWSWCFRFTEKQTIEYFNADSIVGCLLSG